MMKRKVSLVIAVMMLVSMLQIGTVFAAESIDVQTTGLTLPDASAYDVATLDDSLFASFAEPNKTVTVTDIDFQEYVMTFDYQTMQSDADVDSNFLIFIGKDSIRFTPVREDRAKSIGDIFINSKPNVADISDTWNDRLYDVMYWFNHQTTEKYNIYLQKSGADLTIGVKGPGEADYSWVKIATNANDAGSTLKMQNNKYKLAVTNAKVYLPKGEGPVEPPEPEGPETVTLTEGALPTVDLAGYDAKQLEDTAFDVLEQNNKSAAVSDVDFQNYILQFDYRTVSEDFAGDQNFLIHIGKDAIRFRPRGGNDKIQLYTAADAGALPGNWEDRTHLLSYGLKAETTVTYNIYLYKNGADLVFGIKESGADKYSLATITTNANDADTPLRMETTGYGVEIANVQVWTPKAGEPVDPPEPEGPVIVTPQTGALPDADLTAYTENAIADSVLADFALPSVTWATKEITDFDFQEYILRFDLQTVTAAPSTTENLWLLAGNDVVRIFPNHPEEPGVFINHSANPSFPGNWDNRTHELNYPIQPDTSTVYQVHMQKTGNALTVGIKKSTEANYSWMTLETEANEEGSTMSFTTSAVNFNITNAKVYLPKVEQGSMPEVTDFANYDKAVIDSSLLNLLKEDNYGVAGITSIQPTNYVMKFQYRQNQAATGSNQLFWIYAGNDVIKLLPFNGTGIWHRIPDPENYPEPGKGAISEPFDASGYKHAYAMKNDTTTTYDIYMSKFGTKLTFGIREAGETDYEWFEVDGKANTGKEDTPLTFRAFGFKSTIENLEYYVPKDYVIADATYTPGEGTVTVSTSVTRQGANTRDTAIFVTAVYQTAGGAETLYSLQATEETALSYNTEAPFTNTVSVPESGQYMVKSYLWNSFTNMVPIAGEMSKAY